MIYMGKTPKWKVLKNNQLTGWQTHVWCKDEITANAVAQRFRNDLDSVKKYSWVEDAPSSREHWCVTQALEHVVAHTSEVQHGQWYIGIWDKRHQAENVLLSIFNDDDEVDDYRAGVGPIRDSGWVIVATSSVEDRTEVWCYRHQVEPGDCFAYLDEPDQPYIAAEDKDDARLYNPPGGWLVSTRASALEMKRWQAKVKRINRWDAKVEPYVRPCVDPLDKLLRSTANGLTGEECLRRLEATMQCENAVAQKNLAGEVVGYISTLGDNGLNVPQFELAQQCWAAKLAKLMATPAPEKNPIVLDDQDELPNMVYVEDEDDAAHLANAGD